MLMTLNQGSKVMKLEEINLTLRGFGDKNELSSWFLLLAKLLLGLRF
jgi:hypothetical protein